MINVFRSSCFALCALAFTLIWSGISCDSENVLKVTNKRWYPHYHLAPPKGWMNDPNGLVFFDGWYHAFYQHHPYSVKNEMMYWGHAKSRDLVHWEHLPVALKPEGPEDKDGCFSGSAVVDGNTLSLLYTGNRFKGTPQTDDNLYQVQCLATSKDGVTFKREGKIIETPEGLHHFRDPKVWREDNKWYMIVGARVNGSGQVQLYSSPDLKNWDSEGTLTHVEAGMGYMWECPDFYPLNGTRILMFSPQGIAADGYNYRNLYQSGYIVGQWSPNQSFVQKEKFVEMDNGHDFYAPQSLLAPDGRRIVMAWMDMWESIYPEQEDDWVGMLTLPREVILNEKNHLVQRPVKEVELLRNNSYQRKQSTLKDQQEELFTKCEAMEVILHWNQSSSDAEQYGVSIGDGARVYVDNQAQRLVVERNYPKLGLVGTRSIPLPSNPTLTLRLFIDSSSLEVFINDGEATFSSRIYPDPDKRPLNVFSWTGSAVLNGVEAWSYI